LQAFLDKPSSSHDTLATVKCVLAEANAPAAVGETESSA
jgi:hypothetical protein